MIYYTYTPILNNGINMDDSLEKQQFLQDYMKKQIEDERLSNLNFIETQKQIEKQINQILSCLPPSPENLNIHPDEKLKRIPGFLVYYANRKGEIWEWKNNNFHLVTQKENSKFYYIVNITPPSGRRRSFLVHRLVCSTFHGEMPPRSICCHENDIRSDNRADNLYWGNDLTNSLDYQRNKNNPDYLQTRTREHCKRASKLRSRVKAYLKSRMEYVTEEAIIQEIQRRESLLQIKRYEQSLKQEAPLPTTLLQSQCTREQQEAIKELAKQERIKKEREAAFARKVRADIEKENFIKLLPWLQQHNLRKLAEEREQNK